MSSYVPAALRRLVADRASGLCEYCLIHEDDTFFGCEIEHVIATKHGGTTSAENLAYACVFCNRRKGSDISSLSIRTGQLTRLFNPRLDRWSDHLSFASDAMTIVARSDIGDVTTRLLDLNHVDRLIEREALRLIGRFPSPAAVARMIT